MILARPYYWRPVSPLHQANILVVYIGAAAAVAALIVAAAALYAIWRDFGWLPAFGLLLSFGIVVTLTIHVLNSLAIVSRAREHRGGVRHSENARSHRPT